MESESTSTSGDNQLSDSNEFSGAWNRSSLSEKNLTVVGNTSYSREELAVIKKTSVINGLEYLLFLAIDLKERFAFPLPFTDKIGQLTLSVKHKRYFHRWSRLEDTCPSPLIIKEVDCFSVKQTLVSDCSFVCIYI